MDRSTVCEKKNLRDAKLALYCIDFLPQRKLNKQGQRVPVLWFTGNWFKLLECNCHKVDTEFELHCTSVDCVKVNGCWQLNLVNDKWCKVAHLGFEFRFVANKDQFLPYLVAQGKQLKRRWKFYFKQKIILHILPRTLYTASQPTNIWG